MARSDDPTTANHRSGAAPTLWVVVGVAGAWVLIGVILGSQTALGAAMQGSPVVLADAIRAGVMGTLPWVLPTLLAIGMTLRFPLGAGSWRRRLPLHVLAVPVASWLANVGVVLGFWAGAGVFNGFGALARQAAFWATVNIHVAVLVYALAVGITQGWIWLRDSRARELRLARLENQLSRARFQALNAQLRPHFLFNTLHTIGQLWRSGRDEDAEEMLDRLGSLFQRVRTTTESAGIPLRDEIAMVEDYLAIEQRRFRDRLETSVRTETSTSSCLVPPLILQPLVENAIRHGVAPRSEGGCVTVRASEEGGVLTVEICDNGPGLSATPIRPGTGTGVSNTRERLEHAYGPEGVLELSEREGGGVCAVVRMPVRRDPDHDPWDDR